LPAIRNIAITQGATKTILATVLDENNTPIDLTGSKLYLTVKDNKNITIISKISTNSSQILILDQTQTPTKGQAQIMFVAADTKARAVGTYQYDIWLVLPDQSPRPLINPSVFEIKPSVTVFP
jgi:hypothetical protein